jgi:hypothetical protein
MLKQLLKVDVFRVLQEREQNLTPATDRGGVLSALCVFLIVVGVANESWLFFRQDWHSTMAVSKHSLQMETVHFNVTFDNFPCSAVNFEAIEASTGRVYEEQQRTAVINKYRVLSGTVILAKHLDTPRNAAGGSNENGEGCQVAGTFDIDKVPGHFVLSAPRLQGRKPPTDFTVHELWFGTTRISTKDIPENLANSLGGFRGEGESPGMLYQFFINIVPTSFEDNRLGFEYTWTHSHVHAEIPPGLYFHHVHSPLSVMYHKPRVTWSHFLTNLCAVAGGVFTVVGFGAAASARLGKLFEREPAN